MVSRTEVRQFQHVGPLPTPHDLADYERLHPGTAAVIIAMAEKQQTHRLALEAAAQAADIQHRQAIVATQDKSNYRLHRNDGLGQVLGAAVALACVGGAIYTVAAGASPWATGAFLGLPVATMIRSIRSNRKQQP
jgi:uncharacterized membrane protein